MSRPVSFTQEAADLICDRLVDGDSLRKICESEGMPKKSLVMYWAATIPQFADQYARAREAQGDTDADDVGHIARRAADGEIEPAAARAAIDGLKWSAGKRKPKVYGDKLDLSSSDGTMSPRQWMIEAQAVGDRHGE